MNPAPLERRGRERGVALGRRLLQSHERCDYNYWLRDVGRNEP